MTANNEIKIKARHLFFSYSANLVLQDVSLDVCDRTITAIKGPSGQGKSTLLSLFNRLWEDIPDARMQGSVHIRLGGADQDIYHPSCSLPDLRRKVGMVFQKPNPFPKSIYDNVAYGPRIHGLARNKADLDEIVEKCRRTREQLWEEKMARNARCAGHE